MKVGHDISRLNPWTQCGLSRLCCPFDRANKSA